VRDVSVIAIVDDDASFREALERFLGTFAFRVRSFASGEELLQSTELRFVSCHGSSGPVVYEIQTVFVTAHADDEVGQRLVAAGAIAILAKPVDHQMLLRLVQTVVGEQRHK
jgi:FixJ family two-component response regulator